MLIFVVGSYKRSLKHIGIMKKIFIYSACAILLSGCGTMDEFTRSVFATHTGAVIGNVAGSIVGENLGGYKGSFIGSMVGTAAGAMIGASIVARSQENNEREKDYNSSPSPHLDIRDIRLQDENWNRVVDANENCVLIFEIYNDGEKAAFDVKPILKGVEGTQKLNYSRPLVIDRIKPGEGVLYKVNLSASSNVRSGDAIFEIHLEERNGFGTPREEFTIRTQEK
jgi:uncharacterized protein YcfJ